MKQRTWRDTVEKNDEEGTGKQRIWGKNWNLGKERIDKVYLAEPNEIPTEK